MISVIISVYNVEEDLYFCLNSVLRQTYSDFEVICVDDASTDSSLDILEYFSKKDSRVRILKNNFNKGLGYSYNAGLKEAKGDYVLFLRGDDWLRFNALEMLANKVKDEQSDVLIFRSIFQNNQSKSFTNDLREEKLFKFDNKIFNHFNLNKTDLFSIEMNLCNKIYSKSFLDKNNITFPELNRINEEIPFLFKAITSAYKISLMDKGLYISNEKARNLSNSNSERIFDCFEVIYSIFEVFLDNIQIYSYYKNELLNHIFLRLKDRYSQIDEQFKERFFLEIQGVFKNCIRDYDLYDDIVGNVDKDILNFFNFDEIVRMINNPPKTSIIMPVYNTADLLPQVMDSIVNQTIGLENLEVILIDDCSTDGSWEIIESYSRKYDNIVAIHLYENSGSPSKPRNIGIRNASSDYIMFHDSDDCFEIDACRVMYETMAGEEVDCVSGMITRNDTGDYELAFRPWNSVLKQYDEFKNEDIERILASDDLVKKRINSIDENKMILTDYALNSKLFRRALFLENDIRFPEYLNGAEDSVVLFTCFVKLKSFVFVNRVVMEYDVHRSDSLIHNFSLETIQSRPEAYGLMYDIAVSNNRKDLFVDLVLWNKLNYWVNEHLIKAPVLGFEDVMSIFKLNKLLFCECLSRPRLPELLRGICEDIKNNSFDEAVLKVMTKRLEHSNSLGQ